MNVGVSLGVKVGVSVSVGVKVKVGVKVNVGVSLGVRVGVSVWVGVDVGVAVNVDEGVRGAVAVGVGELVTVDVGVAVLVSVAVRVGVHVERPSASAYECSSWSDSYAPISGADPCGRRLPSKSEVNPARAIPASSNGEEASKWKSPPPEFANPGSAPDQVVLPASLYVPDPPLPGSSIQLLLPVRVDPAPI